MGIAQTAIELQDLSDMIATSVAIKLGQLKPYISQNQAYKTYCRGIVERWVSEGLVTLIKDRDKNGAIRIDRLQIECVAKVSNRPSYFSTEDHEKNRPGNPVAVMRSSTTT